MSTDFSIKKAIGKAAIVFLSVAVLFSFSLYAIFLSHIEKVELDRTFYFLISDSTHIEASTHEALAQGGAGYLLSCGKEDYVAYSVYFNEEDADRVSANVSDTSLVKKVASTLYLKSKQDKQNIRIYKNALDNLYEVIKTLNERITALERGMTQQAIKREVCFLSNHCKCLYKTYADAFPLCAKLFEEAWTSLATISSDTVYANKLRYLLCELSDGYVDITSAFSL